jgi:hypothetical protein
MANQMIALGVRAPQMPDLGRATQQYGAMLGVAAQQRASQRQAEQAEQAMEIARNQEQRAATEHVTKQEIDRYAFLRNLYPTVRDDAGHQVWLNAVADASPQAAQVLRQIAPTYSPENSVRLLATADRMINLLASERNSQVVYGRNGEIYFAEFGGLPEGQGVFAPQMFRPDTSGGDGPPAAEGAAPPAAGAPVAPAATPTARVPRGGGDVTPQDLMGQGIPMSAIPMGDPRMRPMSAEAGAGGAAMTPASFGGGMDGMQPLTLETAPQIIQNAVQSRMIDQTHLQQLREMVGPDNERNLASWMQSNQIRIQPTGGMAQPSLRSAEYRPGMDAAPQLQQVQAVTGPGGITYRPTGEVPRGRDPMQSPTQEPRRAGAVAGATEAAEQNVRVTTQPQIRAGEERAVRIERLREQAPRARSDVDAVLSHTARRINAIDRMLTSRSYESIVGAIEGRIPRIVQDPSRATAQRLLDNISNTDVIQDIIASRGQTETGGSPLGNVSNSDLQMYINAANELTQTGDEASFRAALVRMRRELIGGMLRARRTYEDTFRPLGDEMRGLQLEAPQPPAEYTPPPPPSARRRTPTRPEPTHTSRNTRVTYSGSR